MAAFFNSPYILLGHRWLYAGVQDGSGRWRIRLRPVRRRRALGPRHTRAERIVSPRPVRRPAARLAQAVQTGRHPGQTDLCLTRLQDERAAWRSLDHRALNQLRHLNDDSEQPAAGTLDRSRRRAALPA